MAPVNTRYARSGDIHVAYHVVGDGPRDVVFVPPMIFQAEHMWEEAASARFFERLASFSRLIMFDRRGSGMSDPMEGAPTLEERMDDVRAVMDAVGSERAVLLAAQEGGSMAMLFAASFPERVSALVLYACFARAIRSDDIPWASDPDTRLDFADERSRHWGEGLFLSAFAPSAARDPQFLEWGARLERLAASPGTAQRLIELVGRTDVRSVLPHIRVPTLVMHRRDDSLLDVRHGRYLAGRIPGAHFVELEGSDNLPMFGDPESVLEETEEFITGARPAHEPDRVLATVLFTDIVDSTRRAAELGDRRWRELLERHHTLVRKLLARFEGREIKTVGDGFLATFAGPARAIRCACALVAELAALGLRIRAGLHTGECEVMGDDVGGMAVHIGARVGSLAGPEEVLVSSTVKDLVVGSGLSFEDRGERELRGVPGEWRLYAVER